MSKSVKRWIYTFIILTGLLAMSMALIHCAKSSSSSGAIGATVGLTVQNI